MSFLQAWRDEEKDLGRYRDVTMAAREVERLDISAGEENRTRVETVRLGVIMEARKIFCS